MGRRPLFKTHSNIGHAKNAIKNKAPVRKKYVSRERIIHADGTWEWDVKERFVTYNSGLNPRRYGNNNDFYARMFKWENGEWVYMKEFSYEPGGDPIEW